MKDFILDGTIMTQAQILEAIHGYDQAQGKCVDCTPAPVAENKDDQADQIKAGPAKLAAKFVHMEQQRQTGY